MKNRKTEKAEVYFPGLHGLRFVAALMVIFSHVELLKDYHGYPSLYASNFAVYECGRIGVTLFFVLSGFLISYLLLTERRVSGTISIKNFYIRRILRIWPLYYLLVFLAFIVLPRIEFFTIPTYSAALPLNFPFTFTLYLLLLPQVALSIFEPVPYAEPLWSIGVEEQFYLLWPVLLKYFRKFLPLTIVIAVGMFVCRQLVLLLAEANRTSPNLQYWNNLLSYLHFSRIECMAIGGVGAWLVFRQKETVLRIVYNRVFQVLLYALTAWLLLTQHDKPLLNYAPHALCFCLIIVNVSSNKNSLLKLENRLFVLLGNISFSMYMFHEIVIKTVLEVLVRTSGTIFDDMPANVLLHTLSVGLTILVSAAAYYGFERRFLRLKSRFAVVESGQDLIEKGGPLIPVRSGAPS